MDDLTTQFVMTLVPAVVGITAMYTQGLDQKTQNQLSNDLTNTLFKEINNPDTPIGELAADLKYLYAGARENIMQEVRTALKDEIKMELYMELSALQNKNDNICSGECSKVMTNLKEPKIASLEQISPQFAAVAQHRTRVNSGINLHPDEEYFRLKAKHDNTYGSFLG